MDDPHRQEPKAAEITAGPSPDGDSPRAVRSLFLWTAGVVLLAAWRAYDGFKHPEFRSNDLLHALLILLLGAEVWIRRLTRRVLVIKPRWGWGGDMVNHPMSAYLPLLVIVGFVLAQFYDGRQQAAQSALALKKQARQQVVQKQRRASELASEQFRAAIAKQGEAFKVWIETSEKLTLADGKPGFRPTADATRKLEEAKDEYKKAFERDKAEREHLLQLEMERQR
jgi:hypothetical protein